MSRKALLAVIAFVVVAVGIFAASNRLALPKLINDVGDNIQVGDLQFTVHGYRVLEAVSYYDAGMKSWVIIAPERGTYFVAVNLTAGNNGAKEIDALVLGDAEPRFELRGEGTSYKDAAQVGLRGPRFLANFTDASPYFVKPFDLMSISGLKPIDSITGEMLFIVPSHDKASAFVYYDGKKLPAAMLYNKVLPSEQAIFVVKLS